MGNWNPPQYDCSSAVIEALMSSGYFNYDSKIGWTGLLHDSILPKITKSIERKECGPGDIFYLIGPQNKMGFFLHI